LLPVNISCLWYHLHFLSFFQLFLSKQFSPGVSNNRIRALEFSIGNDICELHITTKHLILLTIYFNRHSDLFSFTQAKLNQAQNFNYLLHIISVLY